MNISGHRKTVQQFQRANVKNERTLARAIISGLCQIKIPFASLTYNPESEIFTYVNENVIWRATLRISHINLSYIYICAL